MKKITFVVLLAMLFFTARTTSQNVVWSKTLGGIFQEYGNVITLDPSHNVIIAGTFMEVSYGTGYILYSSGASDVFVQKLSPEGTILWTKQFGNANSDNVHGLATDSSGNIYVAGTFTGSVNFDGAALNSPITNSNFYVLKLDPNGTILWRKAVPGYSSHRPKLLVDRNDNLFLTGVFFGQRTISGLSMDSDNGCGFVMKFNVANGTPLWVTQFGSGRTLDGNPVPINITTSNFVADTAGNLLLTGCFEGHGRFGSQNVLIPNSEARSYIMKMSPAGTILWSKFTTGPTEGTAIVLDGANNIYTAGNYSGTATINNTTYTATADLFSAYFEKLDPDGNLIWFKNYDLKTNTHSKAIPQLAIDSHGNTFLKCIFDDTISFENQSFTALVDATNHYYKDQILASFDKNGINLWAGQFENPNDNTQYGIYPDKATNIAVDDTGLYFTCGNSRFNSQNYSLQSGANVFTAKLSLPYVLGNASFDGNENILVTPNPTSGKVTVALASINENLEVDVLNSLGQKINSASWNQVNMGEIEINGAPGIYFVVVKSDGGSVVRKIIKL